MKYTTLGIVMHAEYTLTKLTSDAAAVAEYYPRVATDIVGSALQFLLAVIAIFLLNFKVVLLITVVTPLLVLAISLFNTPIGRADERQKREEEKGRVLIQEYLDLNKLINLFGVQSRCLANTGCQFEKTYKSKIYFGIWDGVASFLNSMVGNAILLITLGGGAYLAIKGETTVGTLIAMTQLFNYIMKPFSKVAGAVSANAQAKTSAGRIYSILGVPKVDQPAGTAENIGMISLQNVWFGYGDEKVLQGIEATFLRGNAYCIVGENGSGKTTLINLIAGLLSPEKGMVCVKDTKGHDLGRLNGFCTSFVPAEPSLFSDSIRNNITLFDVPVDEDRFTRAVNMALVDAFASDFPNGYDTLIGQHGSTVSSGQAQRIAIARAINWNSDIMIFDEPTSNLDRTSVDILKESIRQLKQDKIVIVISHEQSFESACDVCYHLEEGKLKQI